jgi:hypothetical protein
MVVGLRDVDEDEFGASLSDRLHRRHEGVRWDEHLGTHLDPGGNQSEAKGVQPAAGADAALNATERRELALECGDCRAIRERRTVEEALELGQESILQCGVSVVQVEKRNYWWRAWQ